MIQYWFNRLLLEQHESVLIHYDTRVRVLHELLVQWHKLTMRIDIVQEVWMYLK